MGEFATYNGEQIKVGTCENMYYLRADQINQVHGYDFNFDVDRFRFPFPDEDSIEPGHFESHARGVRIPDYTLPAELSGDEHGQVQFTSRAGYVLSIPCPEQYGQPGMSVDLENVRVDIPEGSAPLRVGRNGFQGHPVVTYQAFRFGYLVTLLSCGACDALHRLDTLEDAEPVIEAFRAEAVRQEHRRLSSDWDAENNRWGESVNYGWERVHPEGSKSFIFYMAMAARIMAGYAILTPGVKV